MGQTLTHGIYLPDEGERNCYNGLAANWQILDTSVGTIAAHTAALAGKAPLVHTHVKADITDFPAYGNAAGTICEGNDSRLSDARTPVAHTHTKSDVTDLLNSNFIPSANNSYDLGSSSYQWNNLYAKKVNTQSLNGINPGALSLPDGRTSAAITIDITDWYVQDPAYPDDPTKKILDATEQTLSSSICGWVEIRFTNAVGNYAYARRWQTGTNMATQKMADGNSDFDKVSFIFPIDTGGLKVRIKAKSATVNIYPCQGNV